MSRGLSTTEQVARWYFNSDESAAKEALSSTPGKMAELCSLDEVPNVEFPDEKAMVIHAEQAILEGEVQHVWSIVDPDYEDAAPIALPRWFGPAIDKTVLLWRQEANVWNKRKEKRLRETGKDFFTPSMQTKYDAWLEDPTRSLVLDKTRQAVVTNVAEKSLQKLKKHCILLVLCLSEIPDQLRIRAGSGKVWGLKLLKGVLPKSIEDAVPKELDYFEGETIVKPKILKNRYILFGTVGSMSFDVELSTECCKNRYIHMQIEYGLNSGLHCRTVTCICQESLVQNIMWKRNMNMMTWKRINSSFFRMPMVMLTMMRSLTRTCQSGFSFKVLIRRVMMNQFQDSK